MDKAGNVSEKLVLSITGTSGTLEAPTINALASQNRPATALSPQIAPRLHSRVGILVELLSKAKMLQIPVSSFQSQVPPPAAIPHLEAGAILLQ